MPNSPAVITSKLAQDHYNDIVSSHSDLVTGISNQQLKVQAFRQQKDQEMLSQQVMDNEMQKEKMTHEQALSKDTLQANKDAMMFAQKQQELDIKKAALSQV